MSYIIKESDTLIENKYCISINNVKKRYINPLVKVQDKYVRIKDISKSAKEDIERALSYTTKKYVYLDFNF